MTREPEIPMSPSELPQQCILEVVTLPPRPEPFDSKVGYWDYSSDKAPKNCPRSPIYLCQVEWAWSPMHNRIDAYHLHRGRTHWSLWSKYWDDNWGQWNWIAIGCVHRQGVEEKQAAVHLLLDFWKGQAEEEDLDHFHWINEDAYLSVAEVMAIARNTWGMQD
jgi:hypothetical protein